MNLSIGTQWLSDFTYFLIVIVMLLNIIFGIIIDTFSSLRADKLKRSTDTLEVCFICSIDKQVFDRASDEPDGFQNHIKLDHNMWNYLYYIFLLWEQDRDDDDGLEQFVRRAIEANEIVWFPLNKAIRLDQAATVEEETLKDISTKLQEYESSVTTKLSSFQNEMNMLLEQISAATRQTYESGEIKNGIANFLRQYNLTEVAVDESVDVLSEATLLHDDDDDEAVEKNSVEEGSEDFNNNETLSEDADELEIAEDEQQLFVSPPTILSKEPIQSNVSECE